MPPELMGRLATKAGDGYLVVVAVLTVVFGLFFLPETFCGKTDDQSLAPRGGG